MRRAGAVLAALTDRVVSGDLPAALRACASGRELIDGGFGADVDVAAEGEACDVVPVLRGESFTAG